MSISLRAVNLRAITSLRAATTGTVVVAGLAFSMSFTKLTALASANGVSGGQAWMLPIIVDGLQVVATVATVAMTRRRWYPWMLLIAGTAVSIAGNIAYSVAATPGNPVAAVIAALPPLALLFVTHLTVMLAHQASTADEAEETPELHAVAA